jgi:hypothetical protein
MCKAPLFGGQGIGGLEFRNVATAIRRFDLVRGAILSFALNCLPKTFPNRFALRYVGLPQHREHASKHEQTCNPRHGHSIFELEVFWYPYL